MTAPKIKPCPWCGETPKLHRSLVFGVMVICETTDCTTGPNTDFMDDEPAAIAAWNNRKEPKP